MVSASSSDTKVKVLRVIGYIGVSVLISKPVLAAFSTWLNVKLPDEATVYLINVLLVGIAKELKKYLPDENKIKQLL